MHGTIDIDESIARLYGLSDGDVREFRLTFCRASNSGNSRQRRKTRRLKARKSVAIPMTIRLMPSNAKSTPKTSNIPAPVQ
jgi:hypothetical protein